MDQPSSDIEEEWRAAVGYPGYEVSDQGNARRSALFDPYGRKVDDAKSVAQHLGGGPRGKDGEYMVRYLEVSLRVSSAVRRHVKVHHLVCITFHGPRPAGMLALHNNGNKKDNRAANLRWGTQSENMFDFHDHRGRQTECSKGHAMTPENVYKNGTGRKCRMCQRERARNRYHTVVKPNSERRNELARMRYSPAVRRAAHERAKSRAR